jgi:hypothetical protein
MHGMTTLVCSSQLWAESERTARRAAAAGWFQFRVQTHKQKQGTAFKMFSPVPNFGSRRSVYHDPFVQVKKKSST